MQKSSIDLKQGSWFIKILKQAWELLDSSDTPQKQISQQQKQKLYQQCSLNYSPVKTPKLKEYLVKKLDFSTDSADMFINTFTKYLKKKQASCINELKNLQNQILQIKKEGGSKTLQYLIRIKFAESYQKRYSNIFKLNLNKQFQIPTLQQIIKKAKKYNAKFLSKTLEKLNQISTSNLQSKYDLYETWKQALNQIEVLNVQKIMNQFKKYNEKDNDFSEKDKIIFIIGPSGVGKTTFSTVMGGHQLQTITQQGQTYYVAKDLLIRQKFRTSNLDSQTIIPGIMRRKDVVFIDCGGFFDRRSQQIDILNNLINQKLAGNIKHMRIVIMMAQKMLGLRGQGLHTFAQAISKYFQSYQLVKDNITIVVNSFDRKSIKKIKDFVGLTAQKIDNGEGTFNQNYKQFIFHLEEILKKQENYVKFDPSNCSQRTVLAKIMKSEQLQDPKTIIKVSFSQESRRKIKQQAQYYSKMIQETYNNRQFEQFRFYMAKLKTLQDKIAKKIDDQCNYLEEVVKFINEKNSSIVQSYSKQLSLFLESNKNEYLNNVIQMKKNIVEISSLQIQNIKTPKKDIDAMETLKSGKIIQYFVNLQKGDTISSNKSITLINAQLRFVKLVNQQKFNQIKERLKEAKQSLKFQFKQLLKKSKTSTQFQRFFLKFQQISVIDEQNLDKTNSLQNNSSQICVWIKDQFIQRHVQNLDNIIKDAKQIKIDSESIDQFFFKLELMKGMSPVIQNMLEKQKAEYEKKLNQLLFDYVQVLRKLQCNVQKLKNFRTYRNNYQELMKVQAIRQKNSISKLKFTDTIQTFIQIQSKNIQMQKDKIIDLINKAYVQNILIEHQLITKIIKNIIKLMNFMITLQNEKDDQFKSIQIKESIKESNIYIISLIQAIQNRIAGQKVQNFEFNLYLLNLFIVASQLNQIHKQLKNKNEGLNNSPSKQSKTDSDIKKIQMQKNTPCQQQVKIINVQTYKRRIQEIEAAVIQKINEPLAQLTSYIQEKNSPKLQIQELKVKSQSNQTQKDQKKIQKKKSSAIKKQIQSQLITESNFQNLKNLFIYFEQLGKIKKLIVQSDSSNCRVSNFKDQTSTEFLKCIQILFEKIKLRFFQLSQCYKHEQFDSERKQNNSQIRQLQYSYQKKSRIYLKSYEQIIIICNKFKKIKIIADFRKDSLQIYNLKDYIETRIRKIIDQYKEGKYEGDYIQINQILNEFGNIIRIYSRAYKISEEDKKQYDQTVLKIRQSKENISKKFNMKIEQIEKRIFNKQLIPLDYIKKYLDQTCLNQKSNKNQIQKLVKSLQFLITQKIDRLFNNPKVIVSQEIETMKLLKYVDQFLQFAQKQKEKGAKSSLHDRYQCNLQNNDPRLQKISNQLFLIFKRQVQRQKEKCQMSFDLSEIQVWDELKNKSDKYKFHLTKRFKAFCLTNYQLGNIENTQMLLKNSIEQKLKQKKYFEKDQILTIDKNLTKIYAAVKGQNKEILNQKIIKKIEQEKLIIQNKKQTNIQQFNKHKQHLKDIKNYFPQEFRIKIQEVIKETQKQFMNQQKVKLENVQKDKQLRNIQQIIKNLEQSKEKKNMELYKKIVRQIVSFLENDINLFNLESEIKTGEITKTLKEYMIKYPHNIDSNENTKQQKEIVKQIFNLRQKFNVEAISHIISLNNKIFQALKEFTKKKNDQGTLLKNISIKAVTQIESFLKSYKRIIQFMEQNKNIYEKQDYKQILCFLKNVCNTFLQTQKKFFNGLNKKDYKKVQEYLIRAHIFKLFTIEFISILDLIKTKIDPTVSQMSKQVTQSDKIERQCQHIYKKISNNMQSFKQISLTIQNLQRMLLIKDFQVNWTNLDEQAKINSNNEYIYNSFKESQDNLTTFYANIKNKLQIQYDSLGTQIISIIGENFKSVEIKNGGILNIYDKLQIMLTKSNYFIFPVSKAKTDFKTFVTDKFYQIKQKNSKFLSQQCIRQIKRLQARTIQDQQKLLDKKRQLKSQCQKQKNAKLKQLKTKFEKDKQDLKKIQKDKEKINQQQELLNKRYNGQKDSFQNQFNQQILIRGVQNEKKLNNCREELKNQISLMIKDKKVIENFIFYRKNISIYGEFYKSSNQNYLTEYLKEIKTSFGKCGGTVISIIYNLLSDKENNFAELIKAQNQFFKIYEKRKFKRQTQKFDLQYLLKNIPEINDNANLIKAIKQKTTVYQKKYDQLLKKYQKSSNRDLLMKQIIEQAHNLAKILKKHYFQNSKLRENNRQHLLAHIFALRTIITAEQNQDGILQFMYAPHPSQILSLFVLLNFVNVKNIDSSDLINYMIQIPTGQGKSVILGGLSAYLGLVGYQVYCACYSKYLSERDYNDFVALFYKLGLKQSIKYQTFSEICKLILNGQKNNFSSKIQEIVKQKNIFEKIGGKFVDLFSSNQFQNIKIRADNESNNKILLIDEADILLSQDFFGELYSPSISLRNPKIQQFTDMLWRTRQKMLPYYDILETKQFKKLVDQYPSLKAVLQNQVYGMMYALKNPQLQKQYFVQDDKVKYKQTDGLSQLVHHGYRTMFTYYSCYDQQKIKSMENLKKMKMINLIIGHFSYALLPKYFKFILGVTGTLKQISPVQSKELKQYCNVQNKLYMPSIYGLNEKNQIKFKKIKKNNLYKDIVQQITRQIQKSRPIAIFFKTEKDLYAFCDSTEFKNYKSTKFNTTIVTFQTKKQQRDRRIQRATMQNTITLFTKQFNRGTDFKNTNQTKDFEGLHVIQTYLPQSMSDYVQIIGRTARQGGNGSVIIYCEISQQIEANQQEKFIEKGQGIKLITQIQKNYWDKKWKIRAQRIGNANHNHYQTSNLYTENKNDAQKVIEKIYEWNRQPIFKDRNFKTVLALDGTGSMSFVFMNLKDILQESFSRLFNILKEKNLQNGFQLSVVIYRNYSSSPHLILQKSNFQTKPEPLIDFLKNVDVDGGMGNQAIQICFNYINRLEVVDQVILIGDAQPNSPSQTKTKRNRYPDNVKDIVQTDIETQTKILLNKHIPVHSYYIAAAQYFIGISKKTGGQACEFNISDRDIATQNLTNFISKKVIQKLDPRGQLLKQYIEKYEKNGVQKRYIN